MNLSEQLSEKFSSLFPTWTTVIATILAILILLLVLTKFVYKPVKKVHDDRKEYIQKNIDEAERLNQDASYDREKANEEIINARVLAAEIISDAKLQAEEVRVEKIALATEEANKLKFDAKKDIESQQLKFDQDSKEAIIEVALAAASEIIEKEIDNKTNRKIVENFIKRSK